MGVQAKRSSRLFMLLGVTLTIVSMIGVYFIAHSSSKSAAGSTVSVLVAAQQIPTHTVITTGNDVNNNFKTVSLPASSKPAGSFSGAFAFEAQMLNGTKQVTAETLYPNEPVLSSMFTNIGSARTGITTAFALKKGQVAVSFQVPLVDESAGAIQPGDNIDIVESYLPRGGGSGPAESSLPSNRAVTQFALQNLKVLAVGQISGTTPSGSSSSTSSSSSSGSTMLTVAVSPQTGLVIQHLKDFAGTWLMSVLLRSAFDNQQYHTTPIGPTWYFSHLFSNF